MEEILTGIKPLLEGELKNAIIFLDNSCPKCGRKMGIVKGKSYSCSIYIRYQCMHCKYICPIEYSIDGKTCSKTVCEDLNPFPSYGQDIKNFISEFGK